MSAKLINIFQKSCKVLMASHKEVMAQRSNDGCTLKYRQQQAEQN